MHVMFDAQNLENFSAKIDLTYSGETRINFSGWMQTVNKGLVLTSNSTFMTREQAKELRDALNLYLGEDEK